MLPTILKVTIKGMKIIRFSIDGTTNAKVERKPAIMSCHGLDRTQKI